MFYRLAALAAIAVAVPALAAQPIAGRWVTPERDAVVAIATCGAKLCGKIVKGLKPSPNGSTTDIRNPDPKLRSRPLIGLPILLDLVAKGDNWEGQIYDPKTGKTYRSIVTRDGPTLKVQGCVAVFCRTMVWTAAS